MEPDQIQRDEELAATVEGKELHEIDGEALAACGRIHVRKLVAAGVIAAPEDADEAPAGKVTARDPLKAVG